MANRRGTIDSIKVGLGVDVRALEKELDTLKGSLQGKEVVLGVRLETPTVADLESKFITPLNNKLKNARARLGVKLPIRFDDKEAEGKLVTFIGRMNEFAKGHPLHIPVEFDYPDEMPEDKARPRRRGGPPPGGAGAGGASSEPPPSGGGRRGGRRGGPPPGGAGATVNPSRPRATNAGPKTPLPPHLKEEAKKTAKKLGISIEEAEDFERQWGDQLPPTTARGAVAAAVQGARRLPDAGPGPVPGAGARQSILQDISRNRRGAGGRFQTPTIASDKQARDALRKLIAKGDPRLQQLLSFMGMGDAKARTRREQASIDQDMPIVNQIISAISNEDPAALNEMFPGDPDRGIIPMGDAFFGNKSRSRVRDAYIAGLPSKKARRVRARMGPGMSEGRKSGLTEVLEDNPLDVLVSALSDAASVREAPTLKKREGIAFADPSGKGRSGGPTRPMMTAKYGQTLQVRARTMEQAVAEAERRFGLHRVAQGSGGRFGGGGYDISAVAREPERTDAELAKIARAQARFEELDAQVQAGGLTGGELDDLIAKRNRAFSTANPYRIFDVTGTATQQRGSIPRPRSTSAAKSTPLPPAGNTNEERMANLRADEERTAQRREQRERENAEALALKKSQRDQALVAAARGYSIGLPRGFGPHRLDSPIPKKSPYLAGLAPGSTYRQYLERSIEPLEKQRQQAEQRARDQANSQAIRMREEAERKAAREAARAAASPAAAPTFMGPPIPRMGKAGGGALHQRMIQAAYDRGDVARGQALQKRLETARGGWTRPSSLSDIPKVAAMAESVVPVGEHGPEAIVNNQFVVPNHQLSAFTKALQGGGRWPAKDLTGRAMGGSINAGGEFGSEWDDLLRRFMTRPGGRGVPMGPEWEDLMGDFLSVSDRVDRDPWAGPTGTGTPFGMTQGQARARLESAFRLPTPPGQSQLQVASLSRGLSPQDRLMAASTAGARARAEQEASFQARLTAPSAPSRLETASLMGAQVRERAEAAATARFQPPVPPPPPPPRITNRGVGPAGLQPADDGRGFGARLGLGFGRPASWQQSMMLMGEEAQAQGRASPFGVMASSNPGQAMNVRVINWPRSFGAPSATSEGPALATEHIGVSPRRPKTGTVGVGGGVGGGGSTGTGDPRDEGESGRVKAVKVDASSTAASLARFSARDAVGDFSDRLDQVGIDISEALQKSPVRALSVALGQIAQTAIGGRAGILERRGFAAAAARGAGFGVNEERAAQELIDRSLFTQGEIQARANAGAALPEDEETFEALTKTIQAQTDRIEQIRPLIERRIQLAEALTRGGMTQAELLSSQQRQRFGFALARDGRIQAADLTKAQRESLGLEDTDSLDANALTPSQQRRLGRVVGVGEEVQVPGILSRRQQIASQAVGLGGIVGGTLLFTAAMSLAQQGLTLIGKVAEDAGDRIVGFGFTLRKVADEIAPTVRERGLAGAAGVAAERRAAIGAPAGFATDATTAFASRLAGVQNIQEQVNALRSERNAAGLRGNVVPGIGAGFGNGFLNTFINQTPGAVEVFGGSLGNPTEARRRAIASFSTGGDPLNPFLGLQGLEDFVFGRPNRNQPATSPQEQAAAVASAVADAQGMTSQSIKLFNDSVDKYAKFTGELTGGRLVRTDDQALLEASGKAITDAGGGPTAFRNAGVAFVGRDNQALSAPNVNRLFQQYIDSALIPALEDLLKSQELAIGAQRRGIEREAAFQRQTATPAAFAEQLLAQPLPTRPLAGVVAPGGIDATAAGAAGKWASSIRSARADLAAIAKQGEQELIGLGVDPQDIEDVRALGTEIAGLKRTSEDLQLGLEQEQYNEQLFISKRSISDLIGLVGKQTAGASKLGILQRQQIMDGRELTRIQLGRSQRELNLQMAIARLQAPGETPEERAIRRREAMLKAREQQRELDISQRTSTRGFEIEDIGFARGLRDAMKQLELLQRSRQVAVEVRGINKVIEAREALLGVRQAFLGTARDAGLEIARAGNRMIVELESRLGELSESERKLTRRFVSGQIAEIERLNSIFGDSDDKPAPMGGRRNRGEAGQDYRLDGAQSRSGMAPPRAAGYLGTTAGATRFMAGEAGTEGVLVLRNPRMGMTGPAGATDSRAPVHIEINMGGITVKNEADEDRLVRKVTRQLHEELALVAGG